MNARDRWIFAHELKSQQLLLLLYYDAHANGDLACFPSFSKAATDCRLARRYVIDTTLKVLCAPGGPMSVVTDRAERSAILAKAGAKDNCRANVYRINYSNGARDAPTDSAQDAPSHRDSARDALTEAEKMAELLAMCVPIAPQDSAPDAPLDGQDSARDALTAPSDGAPEAPLMVHHTHADGAPDDTGIVHGVHPNLKTESKTEPSRAHGGARAREGAPLARSLTGAHGAPREPEAEPTSPTPEPAATTGGGAAEAPTMPPNAFRPPDPFAEWLDDGAPAARALGLAIARPKPIYAPPDELKAARQRLAQQHAELVNS